MNDKKLTDKELEVTPDDKIVAKMKKMVFVDDEDVIRTAIKLARQDEQKRIIRIIEKEKNSIEKNYLLGEKWDEGAKYVVWVLTCLLKEIEGGERGSLENPQVSARSSDELALKSAGGASLHENGSGRTAPAKIEVKGMSRDG